MTAKYLESTPQIANDAFIASNATVIGEARIEEASSVWFYVTIRADIAPISIGHHSNIQDGTVVHVDEDIPTKIGNYVTVGHNCIVHSAEIGDNALIGMGSTILTGAKIGEGALVAAGALVRENFEVPPNTLVAGVPAKIKRELTEEERKDMERNALDYCALGEIYQTKNL